MKKISFWRWFLGSIIIYYMVNLIEYANKEVAALKNKIYNQIVHFFQEILKDENINYMKLSKSFCGAVYANEKFRDDINNDIGTKLKFEISDGNFTFTIEMAKDKEGNIVLFDINKNNK